jgi:release factor glutamine methyltransferase
VSAIVSAAGRTAGCALEWGRRVLGETEEARLEAEILLAAASGTTREALYAYSERPISGDALSKYEAAVRERAEYGCPIAYLTEKKEFAVLSLTMRRGVFIPRPETEGLVEYAAEWWRSAQKSVGGCIIVDPCCGSGAVGISLAYLLGAKVICSDVCETAVALTRSNAQRCGVGHLVEARSGDCIAFLEGTGIPIAAVVANPPYVATPDLKGLSRDILDYEPRGALDGGPDGLRIIRQLAASAARILIPGGLLAFEMGSDQEEGVWPILSSAAWEHFRVERDLAGRPRYVLAVRGGAA